MFYSFFQTAACFIVSSTVALVGLFIVALIQLNVYAAMLDINPSFLGITSNTATILKTLQKDTTAPVILASSPTTQVNTIAMASSGSTNFYTATVLASFPHFLILPIKNTSANFLFLDNTLIVNNMNIQDLQKISPTVAYLLVQEYFPTRHVKAFPKAFVMTQQQFITDQKSVANEKETTVSVDIQKMEDGVSSLSATINSDNEAITTSQDSTNASLKERDKAYDSCLSTGQYIEGKFVPQYSKAYCDGILTTWETALAKQGKNTDALTAKLQQDEEQLKEYQYYGTFFKTQKTLMAVTASNISDELGVFQPPDTIKLVVTSTSSDTLTDYLERLCHEYLHYASFTSGKRFDSSFFEEGFTEYFARRTISDTLHKDTNLAYPAQVNIITTMTKRIAEPDLADMYFSKDEVALEKALNLAYGDNFYKNNYVYFESLMYTADPQETLRLTNLIRKNMGESPVTEKEIFGE